MYGFLDEAQKRDKSQKHHPRMDCRQNRRPFEYIQKVDDSQDLPQSKGRYRNCQIAGGIGGVPCNGDRAGWLRQFRTQTDKCLPETNSGGSGKCHTGGERLGRQE